MTRYVVLIDNGHLGGYFGEIGYVEASSKPAAIRKALRDFLDSPPEADNDPVDMEDVEDERLVAIPVRYFDRYYAVRNGKVVAI